jgi:hypothetical protein
LFPQHIFNVTKAQRESAIKLKRLLAKLGKKASAASAEHGHPRGGAAKVTARQALIG